MCFQVENKVFQGNSLSEPCSAVGQNLAHGDLLTGVSQGAVPVFFPETDF